MSEQAADNRTMQGRVVSDKMDKGITVMIERRVKHPLYGKFVRKSTKVHAHDENNESEVGDTVEIIDQNGHLENRVIPEARTMNSSPPRRATVSESRTDSFSRPATSRSMLSPAR